MWSDVCRDHEAVEVAVAWMGCTLSPRHVWAEGLCGLAVEVAPLVKEGETQFVLEVVFAAYERKVVWVPCAVQWSSEGIEV